ncbi:MAG: hypothetical protein K8H89_08680, partial [Flavobacteriales bacterium]|nr:hypothetical protein [Flavobacteriales bacterium]
MVRIAGEGDTIALPGAVAKLLGITIFAPFGQMQAAERTSRGLVQKTHVRRDQGEAVRRNVREGVQAGVHNPLIDQPPERTAGPELYRKSAIVADLQRKVVDRVTVPTQKI